MKKLPEFGEECRELRNDLKDLLPDSCAIVVLPPLPAALMVKQFKNQICDDPIISPLTSQYL